MTLSSFSPVGGLFLLLAAVALGCSGGDSFIVPTAGTLDITTATSGVEPDPDGYMVQVDDEPAEAIGANASLSKTEMGGGTHTVQLAGLAPNCAVSGDNPRSVVVTVGEATAVAFVVTCGATTGALQVTTATTGDSPDGDGYSITLDGADQGAIGVSGTVTIEQLAPGTHVIGLSGVAGNCQVQGENLHEVTVSAGATSTASFEVVCITPPPGAGALRIITATTGADPDGNGYAVAVDDGPSQAIAINAAVTLGSIAAGPHAVRLSGLAPNCEVQGENPRAVTVAEAATADVSFAITCSGTTGSIQVTTATTGVQVDPDGYSILLDGATWGTVAASSNAMVPRVPAGNHTLGLSGVAPNCVVQGENPRTVTVTAGGSAPVSFEIICTSTTGSLRIVTATTGTNLDADGYTYALDAGAPQSIGVNGDVTVERVAVGEHTIKLDGVASNCTLAGDNPRTATVTGGATAEVSLTVTCAATGLRWTEMPSGSVSSLQGVWGSSLSDVFAVGEGAILHYNGQQWSELSSTTGTLRAVWGSGPTDVFAVGYGRPDGLILHYDGASWTEMTGPGVGRPATDEEFGINVTFRSVWGSAPNNVFGVGDYYDSWYNGLIAHYNGTQWSAVDSDFGDAIFEDVFGTSAVNVYAVGYAHMLSASDFPLAVRYDGTSWTGMGFQGEHLILSGVWASGPNDVFVVGQQSNDAGDLRQGVVYHYNGSAWTLMTVPAVGWIRDIWGASATDIYAVSQDAILHYDGTSWQKVHDQGGNDVWGSSSTDVYVVGVNGRILHGTP